MYALKEEGCTHVIVTTACGSLQEHIHPGDIVIIDQFIDRTTKRPLTFYDGTPGGPVGVSHIPMADPFCNRTRSVLARAVESLGISFHRKGTVVTIEGPRFSTRAESCLFRSWGAELVNMTTVPEVCLAKELGMCYASIALPTDYDCWKGQPVRPLSISLTIYTVYKLWVSNFQTGNFRANHEILSTRFVCVKDLVFTADDDATFLR